jgi:ABC-2 type transport system ATP-binding protein
MNEANPSLAPEPSPTASAVPAIRVHDLRRRFGNVLAVNGLSFEIPQGQVAGFVGANGAGKTTTMRILATLEYPTSGVAEILGINVMDYPSRVRSLLGWMPDSFGTYDNMTVLEYLDFFARALGFKGEERRDRVAEVMRFTELDRWHDRLINQLSKGMGQRLCLGRALIHDPQVLILDEPAAGLDPKARVELRHLIRILAEEGKTILISSHILSELGEMCDTLVFINAGKVVHHGTADSLRLGSQETVSVTVTVDGDPAKLEEWAVLSPHVAFLQSTKTGGRIRIDDARPEVVAGVLRRMVLDGLAVTEFRREERNLEDAFIEMVGKLDREAAAAAAANGGGDPA